MQPSPSGAPVRPIAVVTYEPGGGYGHPDHVQAHDVTMRAVELAEAAGPGGGPWPVPKVYWNVIPERAARAAFADIAASGENPFPEWAEDYMARMEETLGDAYSEPVADVRGYVESMKGAAV